MKSKIKTITAISTIINGHIEFISGQSTRFDNKYIPQFSPDPVHAKEFEESITEDNITITTKEDAANYLSNVHNPYDRQYEIVTLHIPIIKDLKKYDRENKRLSITENTYHGGIKTGQRIRGLITIMAIIVLVSCTKQSAGIYEKINCDVYEERINYYDLDTLPLIMKIGAATGYSSYTWYKDTICDTHFVWNGKDTLFHYGMKEIMDNTADTWYKMCPQPGQNFYWIEHRYYIKNGKKIQPSAYPK